MIFVKQESDCYGMLNCCMRVGEYLTFNSKKDTFLAMGTAFYPYSGG